MQKDFWRNMFRPENRKMRNNALLALMAGILLLAAGNSLFPSEKKEQAEAPPAEESEESHSNKKEADLEQRMAQILSRIEGAGNVEVMLTFSMAEQKVVAQEEKREESRGEESGRVSESLRTETSVVMLEDGRGSFSPLVLSEASPKVEGVVIVAEGGGNPAVCASLNSAAQALLDVPAHKIAVLKMK